MSERRTDSFLDAIPVEVRGTEGQNPAPITPTAPRLAEVADAAVRIYLNSLPSNWASEVEGPLYVDLYKAALNTLTRTVADAVDVSSDAGTPDLIRTEVLRAFIARLLFPAGDPPVHGDLTYRRYLQRVYELLLQGGSLETVVEGAELSVEGEEATASVNLQELLLEVFLSYTPRTLETLGHYHDLDLSPEGDGTTGERVGGGAAHTHTVTGFVVGEAEGHTHDIWSRIPPEYYRLRSVVDATMRLLKWARTTYINRALLRTFVAAASDSLRMSAIDYRYEDVGYDCGGYGPVTGTALAPAGRKLLWDPERDFSRVRVGAPVRVYEPGSASSATETEVVSVRYFPVDDDGTPRGYFTTPTGLTGTAVVSEAGGSLTDPAQDWSLAVPGEVLTMAEGPNAGDYRLAYLLGLEGGPVGRAVTSPVTAVRPWKSVLTLRAPAPYTAAVEYRVDVDFRGSLTPIEFFQDVSDQFYGGGPYSTLRVAGIPLVNASGGEATAADVTVTYDAAPVGVTDVNALDGTITLSAPIAGFAPGDHAVEVEGLRMPGAIFPLRLNRPGYSLNRTNHRSGLVTPTPFGPYPGALSPARGRYGAVLGPQTGPFRARGGEATRIGYRYSALALSGTSALNSPNTLRLNRGPRAYLRQEALAETGSFFPGAGAPDAQGWVALGGGVVYWPGGEFSWVDASGEVALWTRGIAGPPGSSGRVAARVRIESFEPVGVFTGVGVGLSLGTRLFWAGALFINGIGHWGILTRPGLPSEAGSWLVAPRTAATVYAETPTSTKLLRAASGDVPRDLALGRRFQILGGPQEGVYEVGDFFTSGSTTFIQPDPVLPEDPRVPGALEVALLWETALDRETAVRIEGSAVDGQATLWVGEGTGAGAGTTVGPAGLGPDGAPYLPRTVVFGSYDRRTRNVARWAALSYEVSSAAGASRTITLGGALTALPEEGLTWFRGDPWGRTRYASGVLDIVGVAVGPGYQTTTTYAGTDPTLGASSGSSLSLDATVEGEAYAGGWGGVGLELTDGKRRALLSSLRVQDFGTHKALYSPPVLGLVGAADWWTQGWETPPSGAEPLGWAAEGPYAIVRTVAGASAAYRDFAVDMTGWVGRELTLLVGIPEDAEVGALGLGFAVGFRALGRVCFLAWSTLTGVILCGTPGGAPVTIVGPGGWEADGVVREYRLVASDGAATFELYIDGVLQATAAAAAFPASAAYDYGDVTVVAGYDASISESAPGVRLYAATLAPTDEGVSPAPAATWGILRGDAASLDGWSVPRGDALAVPNSDPASVIVGMDWTSSMEVRVTLDPAWGALFYRPDQNPPPSYDGVYARRSVSVGDAWCWVEYGDLPLSASRGVSWGKVNPDVPARSSWETVTYRRSVVGGAAGRGALNRAARATSGDLGKIRAPRTAALLARREGVDLRPIGVTIQRVVSVAAGGVPLPTSLWRREGDRITFVGVTIPDRTAVTVSYIPGGISTDAFLLETPISETRTILCEATPPFPTSQVASLAYEVVSGDGVVSGPLAFPPAGPADPSYFLKDPLRLREPVEPDPEYLYRRVKFFAEPVPGRRGALTQACDNGGFPSTLAVSGPAMGDVVGPVPDSFGTAAFRLSGGSYNGGVLGPAVYVTPAAGPDPTMTGVPLPVIESGFGPTHPFAPSVTFTALVTLTETSPENADAGSYVAQASYPYARVGPWTGLVGDQYYLWGAGPTQPEGYPPAGYEFELLGGSPLPTHTVPTSGSL